MLPCLFRDIEGNGAVHVQIVFRLNLERNLFVGLDLLRTVLLAVLDHSGLRGLSVRRIVTAGFPG